MIQRGQTAPTVNGGKRGASRGFQTKGLDGQPLKTAYGGMTLKDYAAGGNWGQSQKETNATSSAGVPRTATAPCWRKPKGQRVDEKV
jgi:hypothetical protein